MCVHESDVITNPNSEMKVSRRYKGLQDIGDVLCFKVHQTFMQSMQKLSEVKNVISACSMPGMLDQFNDMDAKLEKIQKSLENYLESKRQQFPRFYFLSSDDLLEILGQAKDPMNVQSHLKKCFEGDHSQCGTECLKIITKAQNFCRLWKCSR